MIANHMELREELYKNMLENELGYSGIARRLGLSVSTVKAFLENKKESALPTIARIIKYLRHEGRKIDIFYSDTNNIA